MPQVAASPSSTIPDRKVGIGELDVVRQSGILRTLLGSCIGLVLHDRTHLVGGMSHIVLPSFDGKTEQLGKYANTAVPELIRLIEASGGKSRDLVAKLAGGARMLASPKIGSIGDQNLEFVERLLKEIGIPVVGRHCGGTQGRRIIYDVNTGIVVVEIFGEPPVQL